MKRKPSPAKTAATETRPARRRVRGAEYRRNVISASSFTSPDRTRNGAGWAFTAGQSRRTMETLGTTAGSANVDLSVDLQTMRERSRALIRNNGIAAGAVKTTVDNVVGKGLTPHSRVDAKFLGLTPEAAGEWQTKAERLFRWWSRTRACDVTGRNTFGGLQRLALKSQLGDGDVFALRAKSGRKGAPISFALQLIEADRVSNPLGMVEGKILDHGGYMTQGIETDLDGKALQYHISKRHPGDFIGPGLYQWDKVPAFGASSGEWMTLHVGDMERVAQARGIPMLSPITEDLHQIREFARITLVREAVQALFTAFVTTPGGTGLGDEETTDADSANPEDYRMGPGAILDLQPDETVAFAEPKGVPSSFEMFMNVNLMQAGPAIGIPFEILTKRFQSSYSAARGAQLEFWKTVLVRREIVVEQFCDPAWDAFLADAVSVGALDAPGFFDDPLIREAYTACEWAGPSQGQLDPMKEVMAADARVKLEISTLQREAEQLTGEDWDAIHAQRVEETSRQRADHTDVEPVAERIRTEPMAPGAPEADTEADPNAADIAEQGGQGNQGGG